MKNTEQKKIVLFGSEHCEDWRSVKVVLAERKIEYDFIDITSDMPMLRMFLKMRDTSPAYDELRGGDTIGIPCLQVDNAEYVLEGPEHMERLIEELGLES